MFSSAKNLFLQRAASILIWTAGVLIFVGMTIKDVWPLVSEYKNNNVATQMEIIPSSTTRKAPSIAVCSVYDPMNLRMIAQTLLKVNRTPCYMCEKLRLHDVDIYKWNITTENDKIK